MRFIDARRTHRWYFYQASVSAGRANHSSHAWFQDDDCGGGDSSSEPSSGSGGGGDPEQVFGPQDRGRRAAFWVEGREFRWRERPRRGGRWRSGTGARTPGSRAAFWVEAIDKGDVAQGGDSARGAGPGAGGNSFYFFIPNRRF